MATEVGQATIKLSFDTKSLDKSQAEAQKKMSNAGTTSGSAWGNAWTVAAGNLIAKGIESVVGAINNNLNKAIKRVDTMNNFPKVMANLGISAEASAEVVKDLSDKLMGLPTTLDSATAAVQRFASKNGDVKKSEQIFLAVNDAILAGGASADIQATALEQLSQAYAKGKPDMMEWRTLQTAMPAQLKQVAMAFFDNRDALDSWLSKARQFAKDNPLNSTAKELVEQLEAVAEGSGDMTTALGTALRSGVISMDDFTETLINMDKTGVKGFASLSKQAKDATGGIETSITNLNTAIARAIANVINAIGPARINQAIKGIIDVINGLGNVIAGVVNFIIDNSGVVVSVLAGIGAALATAFVVDKVKSFTVAIQALTTAFTSPTGLIAAAVGLVAALATLVIATDNVEERMSETSKLVQEMGDSLTSNKKSWEELQAAQEKQISTGLSELAYYQSLSDELENIVDENGRVKAGYEERAQFISSKLKDALGLEIQYVDGVVKGYQEIKNSISEVIAQKKAKIILDSQEAGYTEALKRQTEAVQEMGRVDSEMTRKHAEWMMLEQQLEQQRSQMSQQQIKDAQDKIFSLKNEEQALSDTLNAQKDLYGQYTFQVGVYEDNMAKFHAGRYDEMNTATWDYIQKFSDAENAEKAMLEDQINSTRGSMNMLEQLYRETGNEIYNTQLGSQQKRYASLVESHKKYESATQNNQAATVAIWNEGLGKVISTITGKQVDFERAGDGTVTQFVNGEKSKEGSNVQAWNDIMNSGKSAVESYGNTFNSIGANLAKGLADGINKHGGDAVGAMTDIVAQTIAAAKAISKIQSPSRVMAEVGYYMDAGLEMGISKNASSVIEAAKDMTRGVIAAVSGNGEIGIGISSPEVSDHSTMLEEVYLKTADSNAKEQKQPMIVNLELDGQQIQRVILQDERRSTI